MKEEEKTCDTCAHAYYDPAGAGTQNCSSPNYNSQSYTHDMLMEDWSQGRCRFWAPQIQEEHYEKPVFHRSAQPILTHGSTR